MKRTPVSTALGISYPVLQAGLPWVSNPELVAAVSNAGGLGVLHPTTGNEPGGDPVADLHGVIRRVQRLTTKPFGVSFHLPHPQIEQLIEASAQEGITIAITYGGSPALYTGKLKEHNMTVIHQITTVRQARGAEAQGVDMVIAEGFEGGGLRGVDKVSTMVLVPQVVGSIAIPVIASGGIVDSRGYVAATALGAMGVQMGSRFVATKECISHQIYKTAMVAAIDSGTIVVGGDKWPTRILKQGIAIQMRESGLESGDDSAAWEQELGIERTRAAFLDGDFESGIAYTGAGAGLISEILTVQEVFKDLVDGSHSLARKLA
ncbi:MAG: nitronate monooxygenase [Dehalococcoidia bacterium]|jgi:NAD(P)H-dependent flavin oxidoreductase YrpB (nitropropane dioxygenase family)|nr:nitronate monooxygenase [Dehalococcoidia bacterium]